MSATRIGRCPKFYKPLTPTNILIILKYAFRPCVVMGDSRHFKFGTQINNGKYYPTDDKLPPNEGLWSRDHFLKFWDFVNLAPPNLG